MMTRIIRFTTFIPSQLLSQKRVKSRPKRGAVRNQEDHDRDTRARALPGFRTAQVQQYCLVDAEDADGSSVVMARRDGCLYGNLERIGGRTRFRRVRPASLAKRSPVGAG